MGNVDTFIGSVATLAAFDLRSPEAVVQRASERSPHSGYESSQRILIDAKFCSTLVSMLTGRASR
jgi:hypothetical protein